MSRFSSTLALSAAFATAVVLSTTAVNSQATTCLASTANGDVQGVRRTASCAYLGVPYAAPPTVSLRWRPPQPRAPWAPSLVSATVPPPACAQINLQGAFAGVEDCLTLNIWTPASEGARLPVLVWLHPGSFVAASSNLAASDGQRFAEQQNAVVVAPNYRLGPFGFLAHSSLTLEDPTYRASGNYGLADQRAALQWVRQHIAAFGGDPANVTLAGTSAGAISTGTHLVSHASRGLFERVVIQSGFPTSRMASAFEAEMQGEAFAAALGCVDRSAVLACLRSKTQLQVLSALPLAGLPGGQQQFSQGSGSVLWGPVVDGLEVEDQPRQLYARGLFARLPIIIGTNRDDGWTFVDRSYPSGLDPVQYDQAVRAEFGADATSVLNLYPAAAFATPKDALARLTTDSEFVCEARRIARVLHSDGAPVYVYSLEYAVDPVSPGRAFHGLDTNLLFSSNFGAPSNHVLTAADLSVANAMSRSWRQFMDTGNPNADQSVQWPVYRPAPGELPVDPLRERHFVFANRSGVAYGLREQQCNFWESRYFRSVVGAVPAAR